MDPDKRQALINWWNAVGDRKIQRVEELRDGSVLAAVLLSCGDNLIPSDTDLTSPQRCLEAIKFYMESFYQQSLDDCSLINFKLLTNPAVNGEILELEIGKLLLALLGCVIQDRGRENFITPALSMDEKSQSELKLIIMSTICCDDAETKLRPGFHEILRQKQEPMSHVDAALFFKLVAEGGVTTASTPGPKTPNMAHGGPNAAMMYTNSPKSNSGDLSIREISSPLRLMALNSPVTPLGALMSSPQFTQKAALRKKDYEYRRLEAALRNEEHLRSDVEMDLREKSTLVKEKEMKIRDLERQLASSRQTQDMVDELMELRTANETLRKDVSRLQTRLQETQDMREHNTMLQRENAECLADLQRSRDQLKMLESLQSASETYRAKCHKQQVEIGDLELALQHRKEECATLQKTLEDFVNMHEVASENCKILRAEKEELEELLGTRNAEMASGNLGVSLGESMSVVTEKKLAELQAQYETMRTSWIEPLQHTNIVKELQLEKETKKTYEERYTETRKKLLECEDEIQKLHNSLQQSRSTTLDLEGRLQEAGQIQQNLEGEVSHLRSAAEVLRQSEVDLKCNKEQLSEAVESLRTDLGHRQTELELTRKELEVLNESNETRRQTILQLDQEKLQREQAELKLQNELEKISKELEVWKSRGEKLTASEEVVVKLQMEKVDAEKRFTEKIQHQTDEVSKVKDLLKSEQKLNEEKMGDLNEKLQSERTESDNRLQTIHKLQDEMEQFQADVEEKKRTLEDKLENTLKEKRTVDLELHRLTLELSSTKESCDTKIEKMDTAHKDEVDLLKKEINNMRTTKEEGVVTQGQLNKEIGKLNQTVLKQKEETKRLNSVIDSLKSGNTDLVDSIEKSKLRVIQYEHELKTVIEKLNHEQKHNIALTKEKSEMLNSMQGQMEAATKHFNAEKLQLSEQLQKMEFELAEKRREFDDLKCSMGEELTKAQSDYEKKLDSMKNEQESVVDKYEEKLQTLTSSKEEMVETLKSTIRELEEKHKHSENARKELEAALQEKESTIKTLSEQLEYLKETEKYLKSTIVMLETDYDTMKNLIKERDQAKTEMAESNTEKDGQIQQLKESLEAINQTVEKMKEEKMQLQENARKEIDCLKASMSQKTVDFDALQENHSELVQKHEEVTKELKTENENLKDQLQNGSTKRDSLEEEKKVLSSQIEELQRAYSELGSQMHNSNASAENTKQELITKFTKETELRIELESQLKLLGNELQTYKDRLEKISSQKMSTEETLEKLKVDFESEVSELKQRLVSNEEYYNSQYADLQMEYEQGLSEQKEEMEQKEGELKQSYESQIDDLKDDKEMSISSQAQAYQERIIGLEKVLLDKKEDLDKQAQEMVVMEENFNKTLDNMKNELKNQCEMEKGNQIEIERLKGQISEITEEKKKEVEMLIGQYETQLEELRAELNSDFEETKKRFEEESQSQIARLQGEVSEQRENYQQMMCEMQEKLGGETVTLKERLSQMKCQYDTLIENKEKDTRVKLSEYEHQVSDYKTKVSDCEAKLKLFEGEKLSLEGQLAQRNTDNAQLQSELTNISAKFESELCELKENNEKQKVELVDTYKKIEELTEELNQLRASSQQAVETQNRNKGELEELRRQLEYTQARNDTLTAELSSQQQQLAAVEEEKRTVEEEKQGLELEVTSVTDSHNAKFEALTKMCDHRGLEIEELERQLQASQKCYEAVQKTQSKLESEAVRFTEDRDNLEHRNRELEQRVYGFMEREQKMMEEKSYQMEKAAEFNGTLQRRLDEKCQELHKTNEQFSNKIQSMTEEFSQMKQKFEKDMKSLVEEKTALEIDAAQLNKTQEKLKASEAEAKRLQDVNTQYNIHYNKKKEIISSLEEKLKSAERKIATYQQTEDKLLKDVAPLREKLDLERRKNGNLAARINTLEAQNSFADRKIREYKNELEKGTAVFMGDGSEFQKMLQERESETNASFMENHPSSIPLDNSVFKYEKFDVERHQEFYDSTKSMSETLTPNRRSSRSKKKMSKSVSNSTVISAAEKDPDTVSIGSATSLAYRLRSRESAVSLNRSFASLGSCKSNASVPRGTGGIFHCEDEPMEFEWGRLGELQRRNTLCPAHMKTSYPVETQTYQPTKFREDALRESTMGSKNVQELTGSGRKRKQAWDSDSASSDSADGRKQAKTGCVYRKPGPPTPANQRRNSGKGSSRSPGSRSSKGSRSPRTPYGLRKRTPKYTPKGTPKRTSGVDNSENTGSAKKAGWRDSIAFNIGFSPMSTGSHKALRRQQGFIQKQPQSSSQTQPPIRKPLGTRNIMQTGV